MKQIFPIVFFLFNALIVSAQGYVTYDSFSSSTMRDGLGQRFGSGTMSMISAGCDIPVYSAINDLRQPTVWSVGLHGSYASMSCKGEASRLNPDAVVNAAVSASHLRPISPRWSLFATLGCGIYAPSDYIRAKSLLGSGGVIFICRINDNLSLGIGGGVSNSYGPPVVMPMLYLSWHLRRMFEFSIDMSSTIKISASTVLWKNLRLEITPLQIDGLAAVISVDEKDRIYSMAMLRSYISPSWHFSSRFSIFAAVGGNWIRGVSVTDRSLKGFFSSFKDDDDKDPYFSAALRLSAGIRFSF